MGTLTFSTNLTVSGGAALRYDLNADSGLSTNDRVVVNGDVVFNGNAVNFGMLGGSTGGTYRLVEYAGTRSGTLTVGSGAPLGARARCSCAWRCESSRRPSCRAAAAARHCPR